MEDVTPPYQTTRNTENLEAHRRSYEHLENSIESLNKVLQRGFTLRIKMAD
jgi:hypothetical protein